jgi:class 3 adenylate cyclase
LSWQGIIGLQSEPTEVKSLDDRYQDGAVFEGHDPSLIAAGTFILWFGWYGFNAGSAGQLSNGGAELAARAMSATSMSASGAVLMAVVLNYFRFVRFTPQVLCNALLSGLVSITASCTIVELWSALLIGAVGCLIFNAAEKLVTQGRVDDPLQAFAVHGASGVWGGLAAGIFGAEWSTNPASWEQFASQVIGLSVIAAWTVITSTITLYLISRSLRLLRIGGLRVPASEELEGLHTLFSNPEEYGGVRSRDAPTGTITIVSTDVQGSTILWADDPRAMSASTALHDHIMRSQLARYGGYEIITEGDAFLIAFNSPVSAVNFCTQVQIALLHAEWPESIMTFKGCLETHHLDNSEEDRVLQNDEEAMPGSTGDVLASTSQHRTSFATKNDPDRGILIHRGLRVRMGIDVGPCRRQLHPTTHTYRYKGSPIIYAKALVDALPSGGVVAMTHRVQSELAGQMSLLTGSSLCHLGVHVMSEKVRTKCSVFALVPSELEARVLRMKPLEAKFEIAPGYLSAPGVTPITTVNASARGWKRPDHDTLANQLVKRKTLSLHCHDNPNAKPLIIAFASLVLIEEMSTMAPGESFHSGSRTRAARLSQFFQKFPPEERTDKEGEVESQEGSVQRGVAFVSEMFGDSSVTKSGNSVSSSLPAPLLSVVRRNRSEPQLAAMALSIPHSIVDAHLSETDIVGVNGSKAVASLMSDAAGANKSVAGLSSVAAVNESVMVSEPSSRRGSSSGSRMAGEDPERVQRLPGGNHSEMGGSATRVQRSSVSQPGTPARFMTSPVMQTLRNDAEKLAGPLIRMSLALTNGYECQEDEGNDMVAFESALDATRWAAMLCRIIDSMFAGKFAVAVGMQWDMPASISPHASSGRADYFGSVVNTAARIHSFAATRTSTHGTSTAIVSRAAFNQVLVMPAECLPRSVIHDSDNVDLNPIDGGPATTSDVEAAPINRIMDEEDALPSDIELSVARGMGGGRTSSRLNITSTSNAIHPDGGVDTELPKEISLLSQRNHSASDTEGAGLPSIDIPTIKDKLKRGMLFESLGKHKFKGLNQPIELLTAAIPKELSLDLLHLEEAIMGLLDNTESMFDEGDSDCDDSLPCYDGREGSWGSHASCKL